MAATAAAQESGGGTHAAGHREGGGIASGNGPAAVRPSAGAFRYDRDQAGHALDRRSRLDHRRSRSNSSSRNSPRSSRGGNLLGSASDVEKLLAGVLPADEISDIMSDVLGYANRSIWDRISGVSENIFANYLLQGTSADRGADPVEGQARLRRPHDEPSAAADAPRADAPDAQPEAHRRGYRRRSSRRRCMRTSC